MKKPKPKRLTGALLRGSRLARSREPDAVVGPVNGLFAAVPADVLVTEAESMLADARARWELGDWAGLASLSRVEVAAHPQRARLALLAGAGCAQVGDAAAARNWVSLALGWGCPKSLVARVMVSGVHNTLGRALSLAGRHDASTRQFNDAMAVASGQPADLRAHGRAVRELLGLGLLPEAARLVDDKVREATRPDLLPAQAAAQVTMLRSEVELIHHELSLALQRRSAPSPTAVQPIAAGQLSSVAPSQAMDAAVWSEAVERSTSQLGQDLWVLSRSGGKRGGYFVEFGATDGVLLSNTYLLEKSFGWRGLCAEPNPRFFEQLQRNRQCTLSTACIAGVSGKQVKFVLADVYGGLADYVAADSHADKRNAYMAAGEVLMLETVSLNDFLEQHGAPREIDYISIDTEGSEFEILETFPLDRWRVRLFTIEHNHTAMREKIFQRLSAHGYKRTERDFDDWYELAVDTPSEGHSPAAS